MRIVAASLTVFLLCAPAWAQTAGSPPGNPAQRCGTASSTTAESITGDICVSATAIMFQNGARLRLVHYGSVAAFPSDIGTMPADIYQVVAPRHLTLLNGNDFFARWLAVFPGTTGVQGLETFETETAPVNSDNMTGSYFYTPQ